jgi:hypothetical protein
VLRQGGRIVIYGMTAAQQAPFTMREVLRNQQLIGQKQPFCLPPLAVIYYVYI